MLGQPVDYRAKNFSGRDRSVGQPADRSAQKWLEGSGTKLDSKRPAIAGQRLAEAGATGAPHMDLTPFHNEMHIGVRQGFLLLCRLIIEIPADMPIMFNPGCQLD